VRKRRNGWIAGVGALLALATPCAAQIAAPNAWADDPQTSASPDRQPAFAATDPGFGPDLQFAADFVPAAEPGPGVAASSRRDLWLGEDEARLTLRRAGRLRRADGSPLPATPADASYFEAEDYDVSLVRGLPSARGYTASGLEVSLTPHAGVGVGSRGGSAEAGATLRIGSGLERMVPEGSEAFGERPRWYVYAAGSGRAVGYNFARNRDGDFARSGYSHDSGSFLGDASLGVAFRRGAVQSSLGIVYREIEPPGLKGRHNIDTDVDEGLIAFQFSISRD
jgi:hypothetical protein